MGTIDITHALRRIDALEAGGRRVERSLNRCNPDSGLARELARQLAEIDEQLSHWRAVVVRAEAEGIKVWSRKDFARGDFVRYRGIWFEVLRVNAKSLTIPHAVPVPDRPVVRAGEHGGTWTVRYRDGVTGRMSAQDMAARANGDGTGAGDLL